MADASLQFKIQPSSGVPIFRQIIDQVSALVASGRLRAGEMLPSVRELASDLEINMMTVSKAYGQLEMQGIVERVRGTGMRVRQAESSLTKAERKRQLEPFVEALVTRAQQLNLSEVQTLSAVRAALEERRKWLKRSSKSLS